MEVRDGRDFSMLFIFQNFTYVIYVGGVYRKMAKMALLRTTLFQGFFDRFLV